MADQDDDGHHIKGLVVNIFDRYWPTLLRIDGFLAQFRTPLVKASRRGHPTLSFYSLPDHKAWQDAHPADAHLYSTKYYKGLSTSTAAEGKEYFGAVRRNVVDFVWRGPTDSDALKLAFEKGPKFADARKKWLADAPSDSSGLLDHARLGNDRKDGALKYGDFVNKELIVYSRASNVRAIPLFVDGLKPVQRKILSIAFQRNLVRECRVASFASSVIERSAYHHGEKSMCDAVIQMAQDYVGSNNINLLVPSGQFGTRAEGGKNAGSPRYTNTLLSPVARLIFRVEDDALLTRLVDDGKPIEPAYYLPILPMALVNGCDGIGTGWATNVAPRNPRAVIAALRRRLTDQAPPPLAPKSEPPAIKSEKSDHLIDNKPGRAQDSGKSPHDSDDKTGDLRNNDGKLGDSNENKPGEPEDKPRVSDDEGVALRPWARGFTGTIDTTNKVKGGGGGETFASLGVVSKTDDTHLLVTEIPLDVSIDGYKARLEKMREADVVQAFEDETADDKPRFVLTLTPSQMAAAEKIGLHKRLKLVGPITSNMVLWRPPPSESEKVEGGRVQLHLYQTATEIVDAFHGLRLPFYELRRQAMLAKLRSDLDALDHKARFILMVVGEQLQIRNVARATIVANLWRHRFPLRVDTPKQTSTDAETEDDAEELAPSTTSVDAPTGRQIDGARPTDAQMVRGYKYLMGLPLWSITLEHVEELKRQQSAMRTEMERLTGTTPRAMWLADLDLLSDALDADDRARAAAATGLAKRPRKTDATAAPPPRSTSKRPRKP